jgi:hypothetical protein
VTSCNDPDKSTTEVVVVDAVVVVATVVGCATVVVDAAVVAASVVVFKQASSEEHRSVAVASPTQSAPPSCADRATVRVRTLVPAPQPLLQLLQEDQFDQTQSTFMQAFGQSFDSLKLPVQGAPPKRSSVALERVRIVVPPHCCVQVDQADHSESLQLIGQGVPHASSAESSTQDPLNFSATVFVLVFALRPSPHDCEQDDQSDHAET